MATTHMCVHALIHTQGFMQTVILGREKMFLCDTYIHGVVDLRIYAKGGVILWFL